MGKEFYRSVAQEGTHDAIPRIATFWAANDEIQTRFVYSDKFYYSSLSRLFAISVQKRILMGVAWADFLYS